MPLRGEHEPGTWDMSNKQAELIESSGGTKGTSMNGMSVVLLTSLGARSGKLRKTPLMRVEHEGEYAVVASKGGDPAHPDWYHNLTAHPRVTLQDGPVRKDYVTRLVTGEERATWWARAVAAFPLYATYEKRTAREIPVFVLTEADA
ncbi:nitroreductase family deazaflavin-dependent oxidoreductase [Streptomyces sp. 4N509B]|uniref:nitroreductase family deazaflavin-dependent oxidoreductase n=1 Tax=Streptomyces sp. 4N509B TaxID=3457413 RepID=UPI003FD243AC